MAFPPNFRLHIFTTNLARALRRWTNTWKGLGFHRTYARKGSGPIMGLPGFEPGSREPKSPSLDQASRQPLQHEAWVSNDVIESIIKTLSRQQRLGAPTRVLGLSRNYESPSFQRS